MNEKGVLQDIPRPARALRKWDAAVSIDTQAADVP